jgi:hypothetical protein
VLEVVAGRYVIYPLWIILLLGYGFLYFGSGFILNKVSYKLLIYVIIISSISLMVALPVTIMFSFSLMTLMIFTFPSALLGLFGGLLGLREIKNL